MFGLGIGEGLLVLAVVVLLFGGKKLPQLGSSLGKAITNFKQGLKEESKPQIEGQPDKEDSSKESQS